MKPLPEQVREWSAKASDYADKAFPVAPPAEWAMAADMHFAELAAQWGASQAQQTTEPELPEPELHEGVVVTSKGKYKGTEDGYTAAQMHDYAAAKVREAMAQQAIQRGIDKILADPEKHGLDLGEKQ